MSGTVPPIPSHLGSNPSNTALRIKFNAFKTLEGEKVNGTFTRLKCLLNDLENKGVSISQAKVNVTFVNSLPRKWLSMNQTQKANNSIKNDSLATLYGKYNYKEGLIDHIYESKSSKFTIQASSSKALISNTHLQDSDSDVEEDTRSSSKFLADLNVEFHDRALLANQKRFYKRSGRVGSAKNPMDKSNETCFACGKLVHFQKDCPLNKTSTPSYPSSNKTYNKPKFHSNSTPQHNQNVDNHKKDYKGKYKGLKAKTDILTKKIDAMSKGKSEKGLVAESFDWDEESVSFEDEGVTKVKAFMAITEDEPSVGKVDARSNYTYVDLHYVEDQRKNLFSKFNSLNQQLSSCKSELSDLKNTKALNCSLQNEISRLNLENESIKDEISDLKKVIKKWTSSKVTLDQLLNEQVPGNIVCALGGRGKRKDAISQKEMLFTKADESSSETALEITSDSESECDN
ncbi:retrovirus-related pol polyprotein from transposon TNT 1-94 [Tanacetum coccineum]|uniref:Retrovirus-related pol polyprotein from transposon TNT 1-94 n=1 Tax=Tanacetum coccineum TaxID=301880 RepID=A0ABQ5G8K6_9ASTR